LRHAPRVNASRENALGGDVSKGIFLKTLPNRMDSDPLIHTISKWGVSNYFFWEGFGVVAPETCLQSRCLKRK
jgi:hypothetical protein